MTPPVFIDTSYLIALVLDDDALHASALRWSEALSDPLVTTEYVLVEFVDALSPERLRKYVGPALKALQNDPLVRIVPASTELMEEGLSLFAARGDKDWSLTDCISFVVMGRERMTEALTADHHFEQAGFTALLGHPPP